MGTNAIEFFVGQLMHARARKTAIAAASSGHNCGREHTLEVGPFRIHVQVLLVFVEVTQQRALHRNSQAALHPS